MLAYLKLHFYKELFLEGKITYQELETIYHEIFG